MGPEHQLGVFNNNIAAVERALLERYFLVKVNGEFCRPLHVGAEAFEKPSLKRFRKLVVDKVRPLATVLSLRDVVLEYTGAKRRIYEAAYQSLCRTDINRKDAELMPFTKFEKQALDKACRIINPRSPRYNLYLGKFLKKAEKCYYRAINEAWRSCAEHTVIKGLNVVDAACVIRSKWDRFKDPVAIGLDATKFDAHVSVSALKFEHSFYNLVYQDSRLAQLLSWQLLNKGVARCDDGVVEFRMPGTRSSGDLNTSLGNCILMCAMIWALCEELGIEAELANNGDDCVLIMERVNEQRFRNSVERWFTKLGFRMEVEPTVDEFECIEFCQSRPVWDGSSWRMVRNFVTCLKKDPMCLIPIANTVSLLKWMWAVGTCGMAAVPGIPVLQEFYSWFIRHGRRTRKRHMQHIFKNTHFMERAAGLSSEWREPTSEARASFHTAFGITCDEQVALENYFRELDFSADMLDGGEGVVETHSPPIVRYL